MAMQFSGTAHIEAHASIARDFLPRILGLDFRACFLSDESTLSDFWGCELPGERVGKLAWDEAVLSCIQDAYGIDADVDMRLVDVFDAIAASRQTQH